MHDRRTTLVDNRNAVLFLFIWHRHDIRRVSLRVGKEIRRIEAIQQRRHTAFNFIGTRYFTVPCNLPHVFDFFLFPVDDQPFGIIPVDVVAQLVRYLMGYVNLRVAVVL